MRTLVLAALAGLVLVAACESKHDLAADTAGRNGRTDLGKEAAPGTPERRSSGDVAADFVARVVGDTEDVWDALFATMSDSAYSKPGVVLFRARTSSPCGLVYTARGPFYCPADRKVYLDTNSLSSMSPRFDGPGSFGQAYLIVREISHHVQTLLGAMHPDAQAAPQTLDERARQSRIRRELQADCYTGVWAYSVQKRNMLEPGDLEIGVPLAVAMGDPLALGDAKQRTSWFEHGIATGDPRQCDTFAVSQPLR